MQQFVLIDDLDDTSSQPSSTVEMEAAAVDYSTNSLVDNDILNSSLLSGTQMADDKYYAGAHGNDPEFSVSNVPDAMEDDSSQGDLPLPPESLINAGISSPSIPITADTFSPGSVLDGSLNHHFAVQRSVLDGMAASSTITIPSTSQQYGSIVYSTALRPELAGIKVASTPGTFPSLVVISNNVTIAPPSNAGYYLAGDSKPGSFLDKPRSSCGPILDKIPSLLDLEDKSMIAATVPTTSMMEPSSSQHQATISTVSDCITPFYIATQDSTTSGPNDANIFNI